MVRNGEYVSEEDFLHSSSIDKPVTYNALEQFVFYQNFFITSVYFYVFLFLQDTHADNFDLDQFTPVDIFMVLC